MHHAFFKETDHPMTDLNELNIMKEGNPEWILTVATAINTNGDIVGTGLYDEDGDGTKETHGFLLVADTAAGAAPSVPSTPSEPPTIKELPVVVASADSGDLYVRQPVAFSGEGSHDPDGGDIVAYMWDFGDGKSASGMAVSHTYKRAGTYTAALTVTDDEGQRASDSVQITVLKRNGK
jgi:PKD repeat protein